jgi:hypothetical protein
LAVLLQKCGLIAEHAEDNACALHLLARQLCKWQVASSETSVLLLLLQALSSVATAFLESEDLPSNLRPAIVEHMVLVHQSVRRFSTQFAEELRRHNYVTVCVKCTLPASSSVYLCSACG